MKKIVFLDIDGTLVDFNSKMPESAKKALLLAKENGCYIALCTGRTITNIYPWLLEIPFDGIVASAGAYITCGTEKLFHNVLRKDKLSILASQLEEQHASYMLQGVQGRYTDEANRNRLLEYMDSLGLKNTKEITNMTLCEHPYKMEQIESGMYFGSCKEVEEMQAIVDPYFKITGSSFGEDRMYSGEITCMGIDKSTGMQKLMDYMGIQKDCSVAFGDGPNDVEMLQYAHTGVAMGNASEDLKGIADMVTDHILEDGIYNGFCRVGLI